LPPHERVALLAGRLLREGVLQQNALVADDASCTAAKAAALVDAVLSVGERCHALVDGGTPVTAVEEFDFGALVRVREEAASDDATTVAARRDAVLAALGEL